MLTPAKKLNHIEELADRYITNFEKRDSINQPVDIVSAENFLGFIYNTRAEEVLRETAPGPHIYVSVIPTYNESMLVDTATSIFNNIDKTCDLITAPFTGTSLLTFARQLVESETQVPPIHTRNLLDMTPVYVAEERKDRYLFVFETPVNAMNKPREGRCWTKKENISKKGYRIPIILERIKNCRSSSRAA